MATDDHSVPAAGERPQWPAGPIFLLGIVLFVVGELTLPATDPSTRWALAAVPLGLLSAWLLARHYADWWWPRLQAALQAHDDAIEAIPANQLGAWIALAAGVGLFIELLLIRWHASMFQLFAIYKNVSLLAAFLGLGLGYARGAFRPLGTPLVLPAVGLQFLLLYGLGNTVLQEQLQNPVIEQGAMGSPGLSSANMALVVYGFLLLIFALTVLTCIPLGQLAARLMNRQAPLVAYSANLLGSLVGILVFTGLSFLWSPPAVWLLVGCLGLACFLARGASAWTVVPSLLGACVALGLLAMPWKVDLTYLYSPYQVLTVQLRRGDTPEFQANHTYFQRIYDLSAEAQAKYPERQATAAYYELPYHFQPAPAQVLIVGSGTGNDVAAALRRQAGHVDAVEIDPVIMELGRRLHPESPYQDPRVEPIVEDARSFIRRTDRRYDLIVYGLLDSHSQLSSLSSVRLDSFVYTVEGFREARARLKPGGLVVMTFSLVNEKQGRKLFNMLQEAFDGKEPRAFKSDYDAGTTFVIGEGPLPATPAPIPEVTTGVKAVTAPVASSTDDWPFLYMAERKYPVTYVVVIFTLLVVSWFMIRQLLPRGPGQFNPVCFFLGAGFMLVETKSITELGLTLGNTWQVISVVIAGILIMAYLANSIILRWGRMPNALAYGMLAASLVLGLVVSGASLAGLPPLAAQLTMVVILSLPMFFSGFAFSSELARDGNVSAALSSNLLGAMVGGFLEYNSMFFGFRSLYVFALVLYALAFWAAIRKR